MRLVEHRGKWAARIEGKRYSTGIDAKPENREAAEREARKIFDSLKGPVSREISDIMEAYAKDKISEGKDGERCRASARALAPIFGTLSANDITRDLCREFAAQRRGNNISDGTIIRDLKILKAACSWADKKHDGEFWYPQQPEPRDRHISKEELNRLISVSPFHLQVFIHLGYATAARAGALYELTWIQVSFDGEGHIWLGRKANGKKRATVPLTRTLRDVLKEAKLIAETDHVIEYAGKKVSSVKKSWATACREAGLEDFRIHDLRHTSAVHQAGDGVPMSMISQYLGHSNTAITESVYARYQPEHLRDSANALELNRF